MGFGNWTKQERKARKRHLCDECGELIVPGEIYIHWKSCYAEKGEGFWHGEERMHLECERKAEQEAMKDKIESDLEELWEM